MGNRSLFGLLATLGLDELLGEPKSPGSLWAKLGVRGRGLARIVVATVELALYFAFMALVKNSFGTPALSSVGWVSLLATFAFLFLNAGGTILLVTGLVQLLSGKPWMALSDNLRKVLVIFITPLIAIPFFFLVLGGDALVDRIRGSEWYKLRDPNYSELYVQAGKMREVYNACRVADIPIHCECHTLQALKREALELERIAKANPELSDVEMTFPIPGHQNEREVLTVERLLELVELREDVCAGHEG